MANQETAFGLRPVGLAVVQLIALALPPMRLALLILTLSFSMLL